MTWQYVTTTGYTIPHFAFIQKDGTVSVNQRSIGMPRRRCESGEALLPRRGMKPSSANYTALARYGTILHRKLESDRFESDDECDSASNTLSATSMHKLICAIERMRELEEDARRLRMRSGRNSNTKAIEAAIRNADGTVIDAKRAVRRLDSPCEHTVKACAASLKRFWAKCPALKRWHLKQLGCPLPGGNAPHECAGIVRVFPGWYAASTCIRSPGDIQRVLQFIESRYEKAWFDQASLKAVPSTCIPTCLRSARTALLQNLPAWQHARVSLMSRWIVNAKPSVKEISIAAASLSVLTEYSKILCIFRLSLT